MFLSSFSSIPYLSNTMTLTALSIVLIVMLLSVPHKSPNQQALHLIKKVPNISNTMIFTCTSWSRQTGDNPVSLRVHVTPNDSV